MNKYFKLKPEPDELTDTELREKAAEILKQRIAQSHGTIYQPVESKKSSEEDSQNDSDTTDVTEIELGKTIIGEPPASGNEYYTNVKLKQSDPDKKSLKPSVSASPSSSPPREKKEPKQHNSNATYDPRKFSQPQVIQLPQDPNIVKHSDMVISKSPGRKK